MSGPNSVCRPVADNGNGDVLEIAQILAVRAISVRSAFFVSAELTVATSRALYRL